PRRSRPRTRSAPPGLRPPQNSYRSAGWANRTTLPMSRCSLPPMRRATSPDRFWWSTAVCSSVATETGAISDGIAGRSIGVSGIRKVGLPSLPCLTLPEGPSLGGPDIEEPEDEPSALASVYRRDCRAEGAAGGGRLEYA